MEACKDTISVRVTRLNNQLLNKSTKDKAQLLNRECLYDALQLLFDECNSDCLKTSDKQIASFAEKYKKSIIELKQLRVNISDFEVKNVIGQGHFGEVHMVKERQTGDIYAMKTVRKYENSEQKCASFEEERNIMALAQSPWITHLQYAFQDNRNLYFVMEYHPGGDLLGLLYRQGGTLPESAASFYIAELAVAINDLHEMGYVHRDIKPDNILLDRCGHLKLADFGSAVKLNSKGVIPPGGMPVGTPDYIAPEALQSLDKTTKQNGAYGKSCDYWSLGILAYELTIGVTPFASQNTTSTYSKIMNFTKSLKFPADIMLTQSYLTLIKLLLTDQNSRLNFAQIIKQPLFKNFDFNGLRDQVPPFVPKITSVDDTSNFTDVEVKKKQPNIDNFKSKTKFSGKNLPFVGFTYTSEPHDYKEPYRASTLIKDDAVDKLRKEIDTLQRNLLKMDGLALDKDNLERKLEEKVRKLEAVESIRNSLERELTNNIAEYHVLKRTLDLERKDRSELERKALDLMKCAKQKWESAERVKMEAINKELEESKEISEKLQYDVEKLEKELETAWKLSNKHKASIENVEKLRRASVIGLETQLERVTEETGSKVSALERKLKEQTSMKENIEQKLIELQSKENDLLNKLELSEKHCYELKSKCVESETIIKQLKSDIDILIKERKEVDKYESIIHDLEVELATLKVLYQEKIMENENNNVLKKQIKDLKSELNTMMNSKLIAVNELKKTYENEHYQLTNKLKKVGIEKNDLDIKYKEAELSLQDKEEKMNALEEMLGRLQSDLTKLENGSEREAVLQEQIERLEQQLLDEHESSAVEKQEHSQLKSKFWRMEKDLNNAQLDKKIVERDLLESRTKNKELSNDIHNLKQQIDSSKKSNESSLHDLNALNTKLVNEISCLKMEIKSVQKKIDAGKQRENILSEEIVSLKDEVRTKELKVCNVLKTVNDIKNENDILQKKKGELESQMDKYRSNQKSMEIENEKMKSDLKSVQTSLDESLVNRKSLRDACRILEDQLIEFEKILEVSNSKISQLQGEVKEHQNKMDQQKADILSSKKHANEEKSLKLLAETKHKRLNEDFIAIKKELDSYKEDCKEFKEFSNTLSEELNESEQKNASYQITIKSYERQMEQYESENKDLKEEKSAQLTVIINLKESNYKLNKSFTEAKLTITDLVERVNDLESQLLEKTQYYSERELKANSRCEQQTKLIDYLQSKIEDAGKKKKTFSDKLFGISKKENVPPISIALNYKDMELQLKKEKEHTKTLNQEIIKLKSELYAKSENDILNETVKHVNMQDEMLAQIVQSPSSQKNDLYRQNSVQRMHHNIPHRFDSKLCTKPTKCAQCGNHIMLGRHASICRECHLATHTNCSSSLPSTCGLPSAYARHYTESLSKINVEIQNRVNDDEKRITEEINVEGWVKIPNGSSGWEKHYACLTATTFSIYNEPPNNRAATIPIHSLHLNSNNEHGKIVLEPLASEIGVPVANSDLPFIIKVEISPNSTCWPSQCIIFMTLSIEDKEKWYKALHNVFQSPEKFLGDVIFKVTDDLEVNCLVELNKDTRIIGTEAGLYAIQKNKLLHIMGPTKVFEIVVINSLNLILMIVDECRVLISCDLKHMIGLTECAQITKPTLRFKTHSLNNLDGFHIIKATNKNACIANPKQIVIMKYDMGKKEFSPVRILDTAQPVSCILFTEHSLIIGADKFFEVDLLSFEADEFLDVSDTKLSIALKCFKMQSFPLSIMQISSSPIEYLVCFNEFGCFVDAYGRSSRNREIAWVHLPQTFFYSKSYLYVVQFNAVEIFKLTSENCDDEKIETIKFDIQAPRFLGANDKGVYLYSMNDIKYLDAFVLDDNASETTEQRDEVASNSDRFSFTSSIVQSLDDNLSEAEEEVTYVNARKVKFSSTDL
ncbi:PREDICTED: citron Rho-interacting kinase [Nicrophorus vespilloides]|uniref:non-specific serine/threonine protein kinase n=1 Tax=Nicrophorus vespilloides TaxID=110193 RepID=A0ABM1NAE3_NICVS|nr:PREDICTED: citron Rho-interacting kinase [Nicrophorus vespilloides]